jgi:hypothetical protein
MQQFLKPAARPAQAWIVSTQLLDEHLAVANHAQAAFHASFGISAAPPLGRALDLRCALESCAWSCT